CKYIVVTGGVISGLGKGIATAAIGHILNSKLKIIPIKCDGYLNTDPGTMNPVEHGEVFVLDDGGEVDMDFGHYERFLGIKTKFKWNLTMGKIFKSILEKERKGEFLGRTVQFIPHVTDEIKQRIIEITSEENADLALIECGGTVGDLENQFYLEALRQLKNELPPENIFFIHLTYIPIPNGLGEQKSKPTQQSVKALNQIGIDPDIIIGRCGEYITDKIKEKIALFCNLEKNAVISGVEVESVYEIPIIYENQGLAEIIHKKMNIYSPPDLRKWKNLVDIIKSNLINPKRVVRIAICGKYTVLEDSYASVVEALVHAGAHLDVKVEIVWVETTGIEVGETTVHAVLNGIDGVIVPGGFGSRGMEGKIQVIEYVRKNNIPFLGICYGMQLAVVEFARNECGIKDATAREAMQETGAKGVPVIDLLPEQKKIKLKGGTMRLGGQDVLILKGSLANKFYKSQRIRERFRHRYEVNPNYISQMTRKGLVFSGRAPNRRIMQIMEITKHKYFMACQFHPELTSRLEKPSPLFYQLVKKSMS
ncbi:MAG: CTP synthase (glutamine hydrolyzing), partial [bacterium]